MPKAGLEPARLAAGDFESPASTNFTTPATREEPEIMAWPEPGLSDSSVTYAGNPGETRMWYVRVYHLCNSVTSIEVCIITHTIVSVY